MNMLAARAFLYDPLHVAGTLDFQHAPGVTVVFRRIRAVITIAALWGSVLSLCAAALTLLFFGGANGELGRGLFSQLTDLQPITFGLGATAGALFAALVAVAERRQTLRTISERRFRMWGIVAGALPVAILEAVIASGHHRSLMGACYSVFAGGFIGDCLAQPLLYMARNAEVE